MDYTADILATLVAALIGGDAPYGAFTPAEAFGAQIAVAAGGTLINA